MHNFHRMKINNSVCAYAAKTILIVAQLIELSSDWDWDWDWDWDLGPGTWDLGPGTWEMGIE